MAKHPAVKESLNPSLFQVATARTFAPSPQDHHIPCYVYYIAVLLFLIFGLIGFKIYNWFFSPPSRNQQTGAHDRCHFH
ncbi:hypothetical protein P8452_48797 [Trifolium repens]|nr:hypothetical protein P8452_48797 [Trifolium repens]